uniref:Uncharacterized protein n=1 Tax=Kalanchoe fedtschenkoi TaxID=63787 RepID=A0A7N0UIY8_KALFE
MGSTPDLYPLTSIQIGDTKSYLSQAYLYFAPMTKKFFILVDNQSWREKDHSTTIRIWGLVLTKYRMSPFRNTRALLKSQSLKHLSNNCLSNEKNIFKWMAMTCTNNLKRKAAFSFMDLRKVLHGFIVFEVSWNDVRGINYLNELQTDASMALEVKVIRKWEFSDINHALSCLPSWFSGTPPETQALQSSLVYLHGVVPCSSRYVAVSSGELILTNSFRSEVLCEDEFFDVVECTMDAYEDCSTELQEEKPKKEIVTDDIEVDPVGYNDKLLLIQFNDRDLPPKLRQIITSDLKLLTLLESGLPSWVIFLQSYPFFCKFYRPWMRPLVRTLYVIISLITLMIGFYDLYKNVPLLKATASHLCGPLFRWIEAWEMISRIQYLGTMLFLQNFQKSVQWLMTTMRMLKSTVFFVTQPLVGPLEELAEFISPTFSIFTETGGHLFGTVGSAIAYVCGLVVDLLETVFTPFGFLYSYLLTAVSFLWAVAYSLVELLIVPTQYCRIGATYMSSLVSDIYRSTIIGSSVMVRSAHHLKKVAKAKPSSSELSFWHSLSKDLLSKVFRALRSVIFGIAAFFTSCNRHRLRYTWPQYYHGVFTSSRIIFDILFSIVFIELQHI